MKGGSATFAQQAADAGRLARGEGSTAPTASRAKPFPGLQQHNDPPTCLFQTSDWCLTAFRGSQTEFLES